MFLPYPRYSTFIPQLRGPLCSLPGRTSVRREQDRIAGVRACALILSDQSNPFRVH